MRKLPVWLAVGGALVVYLSLAWGAVDLSGGSGQATPEPVQSVGEPNASGRTAATPSGRSFPWTTRPTPGPTQTPLPAGALVGQGETFILASAGVVTHNAKVGITGQGFRPGEPLKVALRGEAFGTEREVGRAFANKEGHLENVSFEMPADLPPGRYVAEVTAPKSGRAARASFQLTGGQPGLEPDTYAGRPGTKVRFAGGGFQPGERIHVYFDSLGADPLGAVVASPTGTIRLASVPVPLSQEGEHAFVFVGERSQRPVRVPFSVTGLYPYIVVDNYTPLPQTSVGVSGEDFYAGERVRIYLNEVGPAPAAVVETSDTGATNAEAAVPIPVDLRGPAVVIAVGEQSGAQATAELTVEEFSPVLELTTYSGAPGTTIAFTGSAFAADETVRVHGGEGQDQRELTSFQTGPNGAFKEAGAFQLPVDTPAGKLALTAVGEKSQVPVSVVFAVQGFQPGLVLTSYAGKAGSNTSFSGSGFVPGETLHAHIGRSQSGQEVASFEVGSDGSFENVGGFVVPYGTPPGQLPIAVVGEESKTPVTVEYTVLPFTPWAGLSSYAGPVGSQVSFIGGSFAPGEIVDVHLGDARGRVILSVTTDDEGKFPLTGPYTVEAGAPEVTFTLVGETSHGSVTTKFKVVEGGPGESEPAHESR